jgi:hypothetical protein
MTNWQIKKITPKAWAKAHKQPTCQRSNQNQPVGVESKPATFFPINRSAMF